VVSTALLSGYLWFRWYFIVWSRESITPSEGTAERADVWNTIGPMVDDRAEILATTARQNAKLDDLCRAAGRGLTLREQFALASKATLAQTRALPSQVRASLSASRAGDSALSTGRQPPDSRLVRDAVELAASVTAAPLLGHCLRCWLWADLFAQLDGIAPDSELLYVACWLHDLALTDAHQPPAEVNCFAVHGGNLARGELVARGATDEFAERVAEAITLHMNVEVPRTFGDEAYLLHAAAHLDVAGRRAGDLQPAAIQAVLFEHPRDGFVKQFGDAMRREAAQRPRSRAALLWRLGMRLPMTHNPLDRR
jgi:hypothetical protein